MANANTVAGITVNGSGRNQFPTQVLTTATETILQIGTDSGTNANYFLVAPSGGTIYGAAQGLDINANPAIVEISAREYGLPSGEVMDQFSSASWDGHPFKVRISGVGNSTAQLAAPVNATFSTALTGGTLLDTTTYYYRVAAINSAGGSSQASTETSLITGNSTANTNTLTVKWAAVAGAVSYKIYGRSTGAELYMATVAAPTLQWVDTGAVTPAGALPSAATGSVVLNLYQGTSASVGSDKAIAGIGSTTVTGAYDFEIEATLMWDATSKILSGWYTTNIGYGSTSAFVGPTVVTNVVTSVAAASLSFLATVTAGFASASNTITVREFVVEKI